MVVASVALCAAQVQKLEAVPEKGADRMTVELVVLLVLVSVHSKVSGRVQPVRLTARKD